MSFERGETSEILHSLSVENAEVHGGVRLHAAHEAARGLGECGAEVLHGHHEVASHGLSRQQSLCERMHAEDDVRCQGGFNSMVTAAT